MLSSFDTKLLNVLQTHLPLSRRPFAEMAKSLGCDEATVLERLQFLKNNGYLRRVGPFFDSGNLGYQGLLVAVKVKDGFMEAVAERINTYDGITHNYEREGEYNLWFTLLSPNAEQENQVIEQITALPGVEKLLRLKSKRKYKVNVQFHLKQVDSVAVG